LATPATNSGSGDREITLSALKFYFLEYFPGNAADAECDENIK